MIMITAAKPDGDFLLPIDYLIKHTSHQIKLSFHLFLKNLITASLNGKLSNLKETELDLVDTYTDEILPF